VDSTTWFGDKRGALADPKRKTIDRGQLSALRAQPFGTQEFLVHEQPVEEDVGVS
jgi:hypothetical protein